MKKNKAFLILIVSFLLLSIVLSGCGGESEVPATDEPTEAPVTEEPSVDNVSADEATEMPTKLNIAVVRYGTLEEPWERTFQESLDRAVAEKPYGLEISYDQTESVVGEDAIRVMREYAESGKYQIIWSTEGAGVDYIQTMYKEFPDIIFVHPGSGGKGLGDNDAWVYNLVYEAAYLNGYIAGLMTETNIVGFIGSFPGGEANTEGNAFIAGAKDANSDVAVKVSFINSWWDPALAKEAAIAQIAAGCDLIFPKVYGAFEALEENGLYGFGGYVDQSDLAPNVVLASTLLLWDANLRYAIDEFWNAAEEGRPYNFSTEPYYALMKDGGAGIAYNEDLIPPDVLAKVRARHDEILSGDFVVPQIWDQPTSD